MTQPQSPTFNGVAIASLVPGLIVTGSTPYRYPSIDLDIDSVSSADESVTTSNYLKSKKLNIQCELGRDTRDLFDSAVDTLYGYLQGLEAALVLPVAGSTRQWTATLSNVAVTDVQGGHGTFDLEFTCAKPFGYDVSSTSLFSTTLSGSSGGASFYAALGGSATWQVPIITITFNSVTVGSGTGFSITNPSTSQTLTVTTSPAAADVYVINCQTRKVTKNGTEITTISGAFPEWQTGIVGSMDYSDSFTSRVRAMTGLYYKRYV